MKKKICMTIRKSIIDLIFLVALLVSPSSTLAEAEEVNTIPTTFSHRLSYPQRTDHAIVKIPLDGFDWQVPIHRDNPDSDKVGTYYHRPIFGFNVRDASKDDFYDLPPWILEIQDDGTGKNVIIKVEVILSDKNFRLGIARSAVIKSDLAYVIDRYNSKNGVDFMLPNTGRTPIDTIEVLPWPMEHMIVQIQVEGLNNFIIAQTETGSLNRIGDTVGLIFSLSYSELTNLKKFAAQNRLEFVFTYRYTGARTVGGRKSLSGSKNIGIAAAQVLSFDQQSGKAPIFQKQYNNIKESARVLLRTWISSQSIELIPLLSAMDSDIVSQLFFPPNVTPVADILERGGVWKDALAQYMIPLINEIKNITGSQDVVSKYGEKDKKDSSETTVGGGIKFQDLLGTFGFSVLGSNQSKHLERELQRVASEYGVTFTKSAVENQYAISQINTYELHDGWQDAKIDHQSVLYVETGSQENYLRDSPIKPIITRDKLNTLNQIEDEESRYLGVQLGMMFPYFGQHLPKGFVWADGGARWPHSKWVAEHLRGKPVPDMRSKLVSGAPTPFAVGKESGGGSIRLPDFTVKGNEFQLPTPSWVTINYLSTKNWPATSLQGKILLDHDTRSLLKKFRTPYVRELKLNEFNRFSLDGSLNPNYEFDLMRVDVEPNSTAVPIFVDVEVKGEQLFKDRYIDLKNPMHMSPNYKSGWIIWCPDCIQNHPTSPFVEIIENTCRILSIFKTGSGNPDYSSITKERFWDAWQAIFANNQEKGQEPLGYLFSLGYIQTQDLNGISKLSPSNIFLNLCEGNLYVKTAPNPN